MTLKSFPCGRSINTRFPLGAPALFHRPLAIDGFPFLNALLLKVEFFDLPTN